MEVRIYNRHKNQISLSREGQDHRKMQMAIPGCFITSFPYEIPQKCDLNVNSFIVLFIMCYII